MAYMDRELDKLCIEIRKKIAEYGYLSGRGHISSSLSLVEVLVALYFDSNIDTEKIRLNSPTRDRVILSKGHAGLALYITLIKAGIMDQKLLEYFATANGILSTHPVFGTANGIEMSSGSLGQGIGFASGVALSGKLTHASYHTYVIVGDGELQEGSNWESMMFAAQMKLDKLTVIIDRNNLQITGRVDEIVSISPLKEKLESFGFYTVEVDGHSRSLIRKALTVSHAGRPLAIIANTVKGKGISFIENEEGWHGRGLSLEQYKEALEELGEE